MKTEKSVALIIDDEEDICFLLGRLLKKKNYEVEEAHKLSEGMKMLKEDRPELLFLDIYLPDGSGLDSLHTIRERFPETKIIMISAYDGIRERVAAEREGITAFLRKPLSNEMV